MRALAHALRNGVARLHHGWRQGAVSRGRAPAAAAGLRQAARWPPSRAYRSELPGQNSDGITTVIYESDNSRRGVLWARGGVILAACFSVFSLFELTYEPLVPDAEYFENLRSGTEIMPRITEKPWFREPAFLTYLCTGFSYVALAIGYMYSKRYVESIVITQDAKMLVTNIRLRTCHFLKFKLREPVDFPVRHLRPGRSKRLHKTLAFSIRGYRMYFIVERSQIMHDPEMLFAMTQGGKHVDALTRTRYSTIRAQRRGPQSKKYAFAS